MRTFVKAVVGIAVLLGFALMLVGLGQRSAVLFGSGIGAVAASFAVKAVHRRLSQEITPMLDPARYHERDL